MGRPAKWIYRRTPRRVGDAGLLLLAAVLRLLIRWAWPDRGVALCYHVVEDRDGLPGPALVPTIAPARFESQLRHLARAYRPVPSARLPASRRHPSRPPPPVAITFDDDHSSYLRATAPILRARGLPGTFFLNGNALDGPHEFWWQTLQRAVDAPGAAGDRAGARQAASRDRARAGDDARPARARRRPQRCSRRRTGRPPRRRASAATSCPR